MRAIYGAVALAGLTLAACSSSQAPIPSQTHETQAGVRRASNPRYIYVTDAGLDKLFIYPAGVPSRTPRSISVPAHPHGVATDTNGNVYVASAEADEINVYNSGATTLEYTISSGLDRPEAVIVDSAGDVYAANPHDNTIVEYGPGRTTVEATFHTLEEPFGGLATDSSGNLYVDVDDGTVEQCSSPLVPCAIIPGVAGAGSFGGLAFVPGQLAVCGTGKINYFTFPGWSPGRQNVEYYGSGVIDRFMTSDSNGTLYIPFIASGLLNPPPPAVVVVSAAFGVAPYTITADLKGPFGAAAGP